MDIVDLINQKLNTNYKSFDELSNSKETLEICLKDNNLYKHIRKFNQQAWDNDNQELFSTIINDYKKQFGGFKLKIITNPNLLTAMYKCDFYPGFYYSATEESLNEDNIKLAFTKGYNNSLIKNNPVALKVWFTNDLDINNPELRDFTESAWNAENANIYIDSLKNNIDIKSIPYSFRISNICLKEAIKRNNFRLVNTFYPNAIDNEEEIGRLIYNCIINNPDSVEKLNVSLYKIKKYYDNAIIKTQKIEYLEGICDESIWTEENIKTYANYLKEKHPTEVNFSFRQLSNYNDILLENDIFNYRISGNKCNLLLLQKKLTEFPNEQFNINWDADNIRNNIRNNLDSYKLLETLIKTKRFDALEKNADFIPYDEKIGKLFSEILEEYMNKGHKIIPYKLGHTKSLQKELIELGCYKEIKDLKDYEIATLYINKCIQNDRIDSNIRSSRLADYALHNVETMDNRRGYYSHYIDYKDDFFNYINEKKDRSQNINALISYLRYDLKTIDEYIKDGYITDKFKKILLFDHTYQQYSLEKNINIYEDIEDVSLLTYLKCAYKVPNLSSGIYINETNYKNYFDEKGPKKELIEFLYNPNSIKVLNSLLNAYPDIEIDHNKRIIIEKLSEIEDTKVLKICFKYINNHKIEDENKLNFLLETASRVTYSNAIEISQFRTEILESVLETPDPIKTLNKIENIFLKENVPFYTKIYSCFQQLYPDFQKKDSNGKNIFDFSENSRMSPDLLYASPNSERMNMYERLVNGDKNKIRFMLVYNDLLRLAINSNNKSLRKYLDSLKKGNDCVLKLLNNNFDINTLNNEEIKTTTNFVNELEVIYEMMSNKPLEEKNLSDKCKTLITFFKPTGRYSLADRVIGATCYYSNIDNIMQITTLMDNNSKNAEKENIEFGEYLKTHKCNLKNGDLLRCIGDFTVLGNSLENGNVCKELLGSIIGKSDSDTTPLDVDFTSIEAKDNIYMSIDGTPTGWGFGNIFIVLKDNYTITRDKDGNILDTEYDPMKMEVFGTKTKKGGYENHWGGRSGSDRTNIKYIIYKKDLRVSKDKPFNEDGSINYIGNEEYNDLPSIKFEMARNGFYIPMVDLNGRLIYSFNEYNNIRSKMAGLSYYDCGKYHINKEDLYFDGIEEVVQDIYDDVNRIKNIGEAICKRIKEIILDPKNNLGIDTITNTFEGDLRDGICELFKTGSTFRLSCVPGDSDFDLMLKVDKRLMMNYDKVRQIIELFINELKPKETIPTKKNRFRGKGITIGEYEDLDIDISLDQRKNNDEYSSEACLNDRYQSIKEQYPDCYELVLANIIKAKQLFKENSKDGIAIYKSQDGGMGGIGVENWILQNGGSLKKAAEDFIKHAYNAKGELIDFDEFKNKYYVFDFGMNHEPKEKKKGVYYPYDNYISDNLNKETYKKISKVLYNYLEKTNNYIENIEESKSK